MPFYAVKHGRVPGIYSSWNDCKEQIDNFPNAWFKKFRTEIEADRCMKSRKSLLQSETQQREKFQDPFKDTHLSPGDVTFLKMQVEIIREKVIKCIDLFSRKMRLISKRIDMVENDINAVSTVPKYVPQNYGTVPEEPRNFPQSYLNNPVPPKEDWLEPLNDNYLQPTKSIHNTWHYPLDTRNTFVPPLIEDKDGFIDVYIDGAVKGNGTEYARGGIGVWFNHGHPLNIADALEGYPTTTNAEIQAATRAIQQAAAAGLRKLNIHTDSTYMIHSITKWIKYWRANNWRTSLGHPVKIKVEIEKLEEAVNSMEAIKWTYIRSHQGNEGNELADILAHTGVSMNGQKRFYSYRFPEELKTPRINY